MNYSHFHAYILYFSVYKKRRQANAYERCPRPPALANYKQGAAPSCVLEKYVHFIIKPNQVHISLSYLFTILRMGMGGVWQ